MKPQLPSRAPLAVDQLVTLLTTASSTSDHQLHGVQIVDGPVKKLSDLEDDAVGVGVGTSDVPGYSSTFEQQPGPGRATYIERVEIALSAVSFSGEPDMKKRRTRVAEILAGVKAVVDANQVVGGAWDAAALGQAMDWFPQQLTSGASVEVAFTVVVRSIV